MYWLLQLGCKNANTSNQQYLCNRRATEAATQHLALPCFAMIRPWRLRICMSIGVNQLLNAASYFILAYYMTEAKPFVRLFVRAENR